MKYNEKTRQIMGNAGVLLPEGAEEKFSEYLELLLERNQDVNLTAITDPEEVLEKHFLDSLAPALPSINIINNRHNASVLDIGSGAGFPGIPLALSCFTWNITLLDSLNKRSDFQEEVKQKLQLDNIEVVNGRAEDLAHEADFREQFDFVVSRAVADLAILSEYALPFLKVGGKFIAYKGPDTDEEIAGAANAAEILGGEILEPFYYELPDCGQRRSLVVIQKVKATPDKYPRRAGIPSKRPL